MRKELLQITKAQVDIFATQHADDIATLATAYSTSKPYILDLYSYGVTLDDMYEVLGASEALNEVEGEQAIRVSAKALATAYLSTRGNLGILSDLTENARTTYLPFGYVTDRRQLDRALYRAVDAWERFGDEYLENPELIREYRFPEEEEN